MLIKIREGVYLNPEEIASLKADAVLLKGGGSIPLEEGEADGLLLTLTDLGLHDVIPMRRPNYGEIPAQVRERLGRAPGYFETGEGSAPGGGD